MRSHNIRECRPLLPLVIRFLLRSIESGQFAKDVLAHLFLLLNLPLLGDSVEILLAARSDVLAGEGPIQVEVKVDDFFTSLPRLGPLWLVLLPVFILGIHLLKCHYYQPIGVLGFWGFGEIGRAHV